MFEWIYDYYRYVCKEIFFFSFLSKKMRKYFQPICLPEHGLPFTNADKKYSSMPTPDQLIDQALDLTKTPN